MTVEFPEEYSFFDFQVHTIQFDCKARNKLNSIVESIDKNRSINSVS